MHRGTDGYDQGRQALYMHCLPGISLESVANRASAKPACSNATASPSIRSKLQALHHRRDDLPGKVRDPSKKLADLVEAAAKRID